MWPNHRLSSLAIQGQLGSLPASQEKLACPFEVCGIGMDPLRAGHCLPSHAESVLFRG